MASNLILIVLCTMLKIANVTSFVSFYLLTKSWFVLHFGRKRTFLLFFFSLSNFNTISIWVLLFQPKWQQAIDPFSKQMFTSRIHYLFSPYRFTEICERTHYYAEDIPFMSHMIAPWWKNLSDTAYVFLRTVCDAEVLQNVL